MRINLIIVHRATASSTLTQYRSRCNSSSTYIFDTNDFEPKLVVITLCKQESISILCYTLFTFINYKKCLKKLLVDSNIFRKRIRLYCWLFFQFKPFHQFPCNVLHDQIKSIRCTYL